MMTNKILTRIVYGVLIAALIFGVWQVVEAAGNIDSVNKWAWSTNAGWLNFNPTDGGATVCSDHLEGYVWGENIGWIRLGTANGCAAHTYSNTTAVNYGVNKDGSGNLSGYGWSTSAGWIKFDPTHGGVTINPATGSFDGYAWGENIGWIHFKRTNAPAYNVAYTLPMQTGPTFTVNTNADTDDGRCDVLGQGSGNKDCTLREAINAANTTGVADTITFAADYTIALASALPTITQDATLDGGAHVVILDGGNNYRILHVQTTIVTVNRLTFRKGSTDTSLTYGNSGGAIYNDNGILNVSNSTFTNNHAGDYGGAIFADGTINITNSTFSNNSANSIGGGVGGTGTLVVKNSTVSGNTSPSGAGLLSQGTLTLINTIIANSTGPDCTNLGTLATTLNNLIESTGTSACGLTNGMNGNKIGVDPMLDMLGNNGGVTETFALQAGSPAIDASDNATCAASPVSNLDQRGSARPTDGNGDYTSTCDIGSHEADALTSCLTKPTKPTLKKPKNNATVTQGKVKFTWSRPNCVVEYQIVVKNVATGKTVFKTTVTDTKATTTNVLPPGTYQWTVTARNGIGKTKSAKFTFTK